MEKGHDRFFDALGAPLTATFEHGDGLGPEDDDDVEDRALLFAGVGYLWLLADESGDAKLGPDTVGALFVSYGGEVLVEERSETSAAGRFVLDRVETTENVLPIPC